MSKELNNSLLKALILHWNPLGPRGGEFIANALADNNQLKILDVSWCNLGRCKDQGEPLYDILNRDVVESEYKVAKQETFIPLTKDERKERDRKLKLEAKKK